MSEFGLGLREVLGNLSFTEGARFDPQGSLHGGSGLAWYEWLGLVRLEFAVFMVEVYNGSLTSVVQVELHKG